ncbi:hypothetical protein I3842_04G130400 [Carya illinoinensis]|uniref:B3 domain-containing protein n=1 Tax=Carya illinoinensis TaxID=32201 RepID=A0A922JVI2_CARIL|nr:hypothetical protein I3842_04G130400 [Carya illinoinensis]
MKSSRPEFSCKSGTTRGLLSGRLRNLISADHSVLFCNPKTPSATVAVRPEYSHDHNSEHGLAKNDVSVPESTLSCRFQSEVASMESKLSCGFDQGLVSTELTLSSGVQIEAKKRKAPEARSSLVSFARIHELFTENPHEGVSTELKLYDESWKYPEKTETVKDRPEEIDPKKSETVKNSAINPKEDSPTVLISYNSKVTVTSNAVTARTRVRRHDKDDLHAEIRTPTAMEDPWKIKKTLTESDLGNMSRLLLKTTWVRHHVLPFLDTDIIREVESEGIRINVWDHDFQSAHELVLKKWKTSKSYVLINMWHKDFVNRRNLKKGDVVGLYWDPSDSMLHFSVLLRRADLIAQPNL